MQFPIQSQPVMRTISTAKTIDGLFPSGNCGKGQWCCKSIFGGNPFCIDCSETLTVFGSCISLQQVDCASHKALPNYDC